MDFYWFTPPDRATAIRYGSFIPFNEKLEDRNVGISYCCPTTGIRSLFTGKSKAVAFRKMMDDLECDYMKMKQTPDWALTDDGRGYLKSLEKWFLEVAYDDTDKESQDN